MSAALIVLLRPLMVRYALARPNARSSHRVPTPQGGGLAVVAGTLAAAGGLLAWRGGAPVLIFFVPIAVFALILTGLGAMDDIRPLPAGRRLLIEIACVGMLVFWLDPPRLGPAWLPLGFERLVIAIAGAWWVNLVNFMDGIDWITCAEIVPLTGAATLIGLAGALAAEPTAIAACLCGAMLGFAPFNRPVARLFLGDVGSLPIGLLTGAVLLGLASAGHLAAAILLPLYYIADATLTLAIRTVRGHRIWEAHRDHWYQRALDRGFTALAVDARVFGLNLGLAVLAALTIRWPAVTWPALAIGAVATGLLLRHLGTKRSV